MNVTKTLFKLIREEVKSPKLIEMIDALENDFRIYEIEAWAADRIPLEKAQDEVSINQTNYEEMLAQLFEIYEALGLEGDQTHKEAIEIIASIREVSETRLRDTVLQGNELSRLKSTIRDLNAKAEAREGKVTELTATIKDQTKSIAIYAEQMTRIADALDVQDGSLFETVIQRIKELLSKELKPTTVTMADVAGEFKTKTNFREVPPIDVTLTNQFISEDPVKAIQHTYGTDPNNEFPDEVVQIEAKWAGPWNHDYTTAQWFNTLWAAASNTVKENIKKATGLEIKAFEAIAIFESERVLEMQKRMKSERLKPLEDYKAYLKKLGAMRMALPGANEK